jgi:hypothetical protein
MPLYSSIIIIIISITIIIIIWKNSELKSVINE